MFSTTSVPNYKIFWFFRFIAFATYIDVYIHSKNYVRRNTKTSYNSEQREYLNMHEGALE